MSKVNGAFRSKRGFTAVDNAIIRDKNISLKAKGLYLVIQSYITNPSFTCTKAFLLSTCMEGEKAFNASWDELKEHGYLRVHFHVEKGKKGFISEYELLDVCEEGPHTFYYDAEGNVTHTNLTKYGKAEKEPERKSENKEKERTPQKGIYVNGSYVKSTYVESAYDERTYDEGGDKLNTPVYSDTEKNPETYNTDYNDSDKDQKINQSINTDSENIKKDGWMDFDAVMEVIKENVGYDYLIQTNVFLDKQLKREKITLDDYDRKYINLRLADQMIRYMADAYCANKDLTISGVRVGSESVKARMMKIDADRFINAYSVLKEKLETVSNKKNYTLSVLFNG